MTWQMISLPFVAALIGWGTNVIAIKMLFWPRKPIKIFFWDFLGVLPKRKADIAKSIAQVLNEDLLPTDELVNAVNTSANRAKVTKHITDNLAFRIERVLPRLIMNSIGSKVRSMLHDLVENEVEKLFAQLGDDISAELKESQLLANLVEEKINSFDLFQLEELVLKVAKDELRYIEVFGALIGLIIGIIQVAFLTLF